MLVIKQSKMHDSYTFVNLHPNKYSQELRYYTFAVNLDRCLGNCNTHIVEYVFQMKQKI